MHEDLFCRERSKGIYYAINYVDIKWQRWIILYCAKTRFYVFSSYYCFIPTAVYWTCVWINDANISVFDFKIHCSRINTVWTLLHVHVCYLIGGMGKGCQQVTRYNIAINKWIISTIYLYWDKYNICLTFSLWALRYWAELPLSGAYIPENLTA